MYSASILFSVLSVLVHCAPTLARRADSNDITKVPVQFGLDDLHLLNHRDLLANGILGGYSNSYRPDGTPYGYGWFHSGPAIEGDRCFANDREGTVANALCIVADINIGEEEAEPFNGWFQQPYYGYGNRFGWYHPGPYLNGDRCYQDGRQGVVQDTLCVDIDATTGRGSNGGLLNGLNLGRRRVWGPEYWREPRFDPAYGFGWFSDGPFAEGDRCWSNGYYGSIVDSLCVLAKVNANLKRETLGGLGGVLNTGGHYNNGDRCFKSGYWGRWRYDDCQILVDATATISDGSYSSTPFRNGDRCWRAGNYGEWLNGDCSPLDLDLDILGRRADEYESPAYDSEESYKSEEQPDAQEAESGSEEESYDAWMEKRLLSYKPGNNKGHALGKTVGNLVDGIKTRNLLGGLGGLGGQKSGNGRTSQLGAADILASVGGDRNSGLTNGNSPLGGLLGGSRNGGGLLGRRSHRFGQSDNNDALNELVNAIGLAKRALENYEISKRGHRKTGGALSDLPVLGGRL